MKQLAALFIAITLLTACTTTREMRRDNRAARKLARLVERFPSLQRSDSLLVPITMRTPRVQGTIFSPAIQLRPIDEGKYILKLRSKQVPTAGANAYSTQPAASMPPFTIDFTDSILDARLTFDGTTFSLDYNINPMQADTAVTVHYDTIQPVQHEKISFWQKIRVFSNHIAIAIGVLILFIIIWVLTRKK